MSPPVGFPIWPAFQDRRGGAPASRVGERGHGEDAEPGALGDCHADCRGLVVVQCDGVQGGRADPVEDGLAKSRDVTARNHCQERREPAFVGATGCYDSRSGHEAPIDHFGEVGDMDVGGGLDLEAAGGQDVVERGGGARPPAIPGTARRGRAGRRRSPRPPASPPAAPHRTLRSAAPSSTAERPPPASPAVATRQRPAPPKPATRSPQPPRRPAPSRPRPIRTPRRAYLATPSRHRLGTHRTLAIPPQVSPVRSRGTRALSEPREEFAYTPL